MNKPVVKTPYNCLVPGCTNFANAKSMWCDAHLDDWLERRPPRDLPGSDGSHLEREAPAAKETAGEQA